MKNQALFSSKDKSKKLKCHLLQFLFGALRVKSGLPLRREATNETESVLPLERVASHFKQRDNCSIVRFICHHYNNDYKNFAIFFLDKLMLHVT